MMMVVMVEMKMMMTIKRMADYYDDAGGCGNGEEDDHDED